MPPIAQAETGAANRLGAVATKALILGISYFIAARLGLLLALPHPAITLIWLPTGIATAGLLRWGLGYWPAIFCSAALLQEFSFEIDWPLAGFLVAGQTLAPVLTAAMLRRSGFHFDFDRRRDICLFAGLTGFGMMFSALIGVATLSYAGQISPESFFFAWRQWWLGDWMGVLVAGPLLISTSWKNWDALLERGREVVIFCLVLAGASGSICSLSPSPAILPLIFIPFILTIWAALRLGVMGTSLAVLFVAVVAAAGSAAELGPFLYSSSSESVFLLWAYLITATVFNLMITGIEIGRSSARRELLESKLRLQNTNEELAASVAQAETLAIKANAASHAKGVFLSNMSHEIRTPLNGMIGMTDLLLQSPLNEEQRQYAKVASSCSESLLRLIDDILDFSKMEAGKLSLAHCDFNLREVVDRTFDVLAPTFTGGIDLSCEIQPGTPTDLHGDPGRLGQVLLNLVHNAMKFTQRGTVRLTVGVEKNEGDSVMLRFEIRDSGPGISPDWLAQLFQPFVQVDSSTTRKFGGTGLGLAISKQLTELMGGTIGASSTEGKGSLFWFTAVFRLKKVD
jgi:signal transduction histidine kinase